MNKREVIPIKDYYVGIHMPNENEAIASLKGNLVPEDFVGSIFLYGDEDYLIESAEYLMPPEPTTRKERLLGNREPNRGKFAKLSVKKLS